MMRACPLPRSSCASAPTSSGGLRQRALVALGLIGDPELLVADEPTTALDAGHRARVLEALAAARRRGAAALLISHDLCGACAMSPIWCS